MDFSIDFLAQMSASYETNPFFPNLLYNPHRAISLLLGRATNVSFLPQARENVQITSFNRLAHDVSSVYILVCLP